MTASSDQRTVATQLDCLTCSLLVRPTALGRSLQMQDRIQSDIFPDLWPNGKDSIQRSAPTMNRMSGRPIARSLNAISGSTSGRQWMVIYPRILTETFSTFTGLRLTFSYGYAARRCDARGDWIAAPPKACLGASAD